MTDAEFLQAVKRSVLEIDPQAEVWLFGSRARGDAKEDSDWDFLVLTNNIVDRQFKYKVWEHLNDLELNAERVISSRIFNKIYWRSLAVTDLFRNIQEDGRCV
ncbi:nucleotidyltransferase domain-containing protein [Spirosoma soli]|uniref:Nucleotidyltransferase domain-containing protein n=1 Tax=Spirosoma soli TaxID=1770529 RepID=A0ABW5M9M0_9BACT